MSPPPPPRRAILRGPPPALSGSLAGSPRQSYQANHCEQLGSWRARGCTGSDSHSSYGRRPQSFGVCGEIEHIARVGGVVRSHHSGHLDDILYVHSDRMCTHFHLRWGTINITCTHTHSDLVLRTRPNPSYPLPLERLLGRPYSLELPSPPTSPRENHVWVANGWCEHVSRSTVHHSLRIGKPASCILTMAITTREPKFPLTHR